MKKVLLTLVCACALTLGAAFSAQAENLGVYVAPKFLMGWQNNHSSFTQTAGGRTGSGDQFISQFGLGGGLSVGYDFWHQFKLPVRAELEFAMRGDSSNTEEGTFGSGSVYEELKSTFNATTLMANFFYDFRNDSDFTPYVMAGAGVAFIRSEVEYRGEFGNRDIHMSDSDNFTNFAWNIGAGVAYNVNENIAVDLGYRYLNLGSVSSSGGYSTFAGHANWDADNYAYNHEIALGVRFTF